MWFCLLVSCIKSVFERWVEPRWRVTGFRGRELVRPCAVLHTFSAASAGRNMRWDLPKTPFLHAISRAAKFNNGMQFWTVWSYSRQRQWSNCSGCVTVTTDNSVNSLLALTLGYCHTKLTWRSGSLSLSQVGPCHRQKWGPVTVTSGALSPWQVRPCHCDKCPYYHDKWVPVTATIVSLSSC